MSKTVTFKNEALNKHRALADSIKSNLKREANHIAEVESHKAYHENLPEGLSPELINELRKYDGKYTKASAIAVGEFAAAVFQQDKEVKELTAQVGFLGKGDSLNFSIDREREFPVPKGKDEPEDAPRRTTVKHLYVSSPVVELTGKSVKSVTSLMSEEFKDSFAS